MSSLETNVLVADLGFAESPRWHDGELWFSDFFSRRVQSVDEAGRVTVRGYVPGQPSGMGFRPDGSVLVASTHSRELVQLVDGLAKVVVSTSAVFAGVLNDMVVDRAGRAYVSPLALGAAPLLYFDGSTARIGAEDLAGPNGLVLADDGHTLIVAETGGNRLTAFDVAADGALGARRLFADLGDLSPDGICLDAEGAIWAGCPFAEQFVRVAEGGEILDRVAVPGRWAVAPALGGPAAHHAVLHDGSHDVAPFPSRRRNSGNRDLPRASTGNAMTKGADKMDYDFSGLGFRPGDLVVVTGAASGIGSATASLAARSGLTVACWDMDEQRLESVVAGIRTAGGQAQAIGCDVTSAEDIERAWAATAQIGPPRYLVNNAGPPATAKFTVAEGVAAAAGSMAAVTEHWLAAFSEQAEAVTFTASVAGNFLATPNGSYWYAAAKAAIAAYARELAVHRKGQPRANVIAPGVTITGRTARLAGSPAGDRMAARVPMGRLGEADEMAAAICFLLSPAASYINGVTVPVDGGAILLG